MTKPKSKRVSIKCWGAFDKHIKLPNSVERDPSMFGEWARRNLVIRPITISYTIPGASRGKK